MSVIKGMLEQYAEHARHSTGLHYVPSFNNNDLCTQDDLEEQELSSSASLAAPLERASVPDEPRHSNKQDSAWPMFQAADIHKVNVHDGSRSARHLFDTAKAGSIWQEVIKGEQLKARSFRSLDSDNDGYLSPTEILVGLRTTREKAAQLVREADKDGDGRISEDEYAEILERFGSE